MAFVLLKDGTQDSTDSFVGSWRRYREYLASIADRLPAAARDFALGEWHHDFSDHRAPHDSWVESVQIYETASGERKEIRQIQIKVRLLGAYHDGYIEIEYKNVAQYSMASDYPNHGSWLYDEVRLSDTGSVIHEVEIGGSTWVIECEDIHYIWLPEG